MSTNGAGFYITAGLPIAKETAQSSTNGAGHFITAGLPKQVEAAAAGLAFFPWHVRPHKKDFDSIIGR